VMQRANLGRRPSPAHDCGTLTLKKRSTRQRVSDTALSLPRKLGRGFVETSGAPRVLSWRSPRRSSDQGTHSRRFPEPPPWPKTRRGSRLQIRLLFFGFQSRGSSRQAFRFKQNPGWNDLPVRRPT